MFNAQLTEQLKTNHSSRRRVRNQRTRPNLSQACRKTKLCAYYLQGFCPNGADCGFAHGEHEMVLPPNLHGTKLCPMLHLGGCTRRDCKFAHSDYELRDFAMATPKAMELKGTLGYYMSSFGLTENPDADTMSDVSTRGSGCQSELPASEDSNDFELSDIGYEVIVQHTFLHVRSTDTSDDDASVTHALRERRRASSCPAPHERMKL